MSNTSHTWRLLLFFLFAGLFFTACDPDDDTPVTVEAVFNNGSPNFKWDSDGKFLIITSNGDWDIAVSFPSGKPSGWCTATTSSGNGNKNVWIATAYNTSDSSRHATLTVASGGQKVDIALMQYGKGDVPPETRTRMELPKIEDVEWYLEYTDGKFALEYAPAKKHSKWVAWPLYKSCMGSSGRTDAWQWDPRIPEQYWSVQADFGKNGYDRGHLCPSADRTQSTRMNAQTFMYSNMSPQIPSFNQGIWADLETKERNWANGADTLYICAGGTVLKESDIDRYTSPSSMAVPKYYFKVILRKKTSTGAYDAIGFWFENRSYSTSLSAQVKTIDQIEALTGIDFFYNLPEPVQSQVESLFNPSAWGF